MIRHRLNAIDALESLPQLRELALYPGEGNKLDVSVLAKLADFERLSIVSNGIEKLDFLLSMPKLKTLELRSNPIADFKPIGQLQCGPSL